MPSWPARMTSGSSPGDVLVISPAPRVRRGPTVDPHRWPFGELCAPGTKWRRRGGATGSWRELGKTRYFKLLQLYGSPLGGTHSLKCLLVQIATHALSALPLGSFHSTPGGGGEVTGAGAGPRGQCWLAACPGVPQGALPVSGMPWGSDPP
jgi:hypothetical protein